MSAQVDALMAHGREIGVTQRSVRQASADGRRLVLEPDGLDVLGFATSNYLALERDPHLVAGAIAATASHGVNFSASRCFVRSSLYVEAEALLEQVFGGPVVIAGSTTLAHAAALPILVGPNDVVLYDAQVHHSVQVALASVPAKAKRILPHADLGALERAVAETTGAGTVWYCADGVYSMFGDRLDYDGVADVMRRHPRLFAYVDDAHGMSWDGTRGAGTWTDHDLPRDRTVVVTSLSKGFGAGGGAILTPDVATKQRIENLGPSLMFGIQLPPPVLGAVCASARLHLTDEIGKMQRRLAGTVASAREQLAREPKVAARLRVGRGAATPIVYFVVGDGEAAAGAGRWLMDRGVFLNPVAYPAVPKHLGGLRATLTRAHRPEDVATLVEALAELADTLPPFDPAAMRTTPLPARNRPSVPAER